MTSLICLIFTTSLLHKFSRATSKSTYTEHHPRVFPQTCETLCIRRRGTRARLQTAGRCRGTARPTRDVQRYLARLMCCSKPLVQPRATVVHTRLSTRTRARNDRRVLEDGCKYYVLFSFDKPRQIAREVATDFVSTRMAGLQSVGSKLGLQPI
jgi:hypothetical protein